MTKIKDWVDLADQTVRNFKPNEVTSLYSAEWLETQRTLASDHADEISRERKKLKRVFWTVNAILYGLAKRLAPHRRVIFAISFVGFFWAALHFLRVQDIVGPWPYLIGFGAFLGMMALVGMELVDKLKIRNELELARDLQASLLPDQLPKVPGFQIAAFNRIANTVGGDIYDFVPLKDGRLAVLFGDASGHGMAAGLVMAVAHAAFRTQLDVDPSPRAIINSLNTILCRTGGTRSFFAVAYLLISPDGSFRLIMAGHPEVLRVDGGGRVTERIGKGAYPLGIKEGEEWSEIDGLLAEGESLVLHSDGLTESRNPRGQDLGDDYLETIISWRAGGSATEILEEIVDEWRRFCSGFPVEDDVTVAVIRRRDS
jgi:hypothetical protein